MTKPLSASLAALLGLAVASAGALASDDQRHGLRYEVTITNLTRGQVFSPPLVATHPRDVALFEAGQPASDELAALAQDGDAGPLAALLGAVPGAHVTVAGGPVIPGGTITLEVDAGSPNAVLSVAGMLVTTNDAFFSVNGTRLPLSRRVTLSRKANAYDAGSEGNDELCAFIPGPPCGNPHQTSGEGAEGYVHVHAGIHGIGNLDPSVNDWRNPVAGVTVRRIVGR